MNNETIAKRIKGTTAPPSVIDAVSKLIAENERQSKELAEQSIKLLVLNEVVSERDQAIELLRAVVDAANQYEEISQPIMAADRWLFENVENYQ